MTVQRKMDTKSNDNNRSKPSVSSVLEKYKSGPGFDLAQNMTSAKQKFGKSYFAQVREMAKLAFGRLKLQPHEYFAYRLYEDKNYSPEQKQCFIGEQAQDKIFQQVNDISWWGVAHDKLMFDTMLKGLNLPRAKIYAIYHPLRNHGSVPVLRHHEKLADFLRKDMPYPFFAKPVTGMYSLGTVKAFGVDREEDDIFITSSPAVNVQAFADEVVAYGTDGYIFQECLSPHPVIEEICGPRLSTIRLVIALTNNGPEIMRSIWKIPTGDNIADNFWRPGNILAALDSDSGTVLRSVQGTGPQQIGVDRHPDTAQLIKGITLPDWQNVKDLAISSAYAFPNLRLQAWDIALTNRGPVLLELNIGGDFVLPQIATGRPSMDPRFVDFLESCKRN